MAIKLNTEKIMQHLKEEQRPVSWLAWKIGISPELMQYHLKKQLPGKADAIADAIGEKNPKNLLIVVE